MKTDINFRKKIFWTAGIASLALFAASCNSSDDTGETDYVPGNNASMTITLQGETVRSRAVAPTTDPEIAALEAAENKINNVTVFVFNNNGTLDKKQDFALPGLTETITGLVAGPKKVVVVANTPSGTTYPAGINYSWFANQANAIDLGSQEPATNGLFMSGEDAVVLSSEATATKTIKISRVAAKVKLGTVTLAPEAGHDPAKFALTGVLIMKARGAATMGIPAVNYTPDLFYGGMAGDLSQEKSYLAETISVSDFANRYFYVLPSDNADSNTTLITLAGTYDGTPVYFPFRINDKAGTGGATSDGTFIKRNTGYVVNVTLKRLGGGTDNPETPADPASLTVTVEPQPWETDLVQNVEW